MAIRTYYWNDRKVPLLDYYKIRFKNKKRMVFRYGNAGDIFNYDLLKFLYNEEPQNMKKQGDRLLLVGSVMSVLEKGDIVNGIGWKGNDLSEKEEIIESAVVNGVRGPLTKSLFEKYGADLSNLKFEYDPGLLIKEVYNLNMKRSSEKNVIFIPHYRDVWAYRGNYPEGVKMVNIDNTPQKVAKEIMKAKIVYASSLHGIIFAHAMGKECVFVAPQSEEPIFKYRDYYLSIGQEMPEPVKDIHSTNYRTDKGTLLDRKVGLDDFFFPTKESLQQKNIIVK